MVCRDILLFHPLGTLTRQAFETQHNMSDEVSVDSGILVMAILCGRLCKDDL